MKQTLRDMLTQQLAHYKEVVIKMNDSMHDKSRRHEYSDAAIAQARVRELSIVIADIEHMLK